MHIFPLWSVSRSYNCEPCCFELKATQAHKDEAPSFLHPTIVASNCLIFCIKLLLLNLNEEGCCRAAGLWPSEYICRTQIWVSCDSSAANCHPSILQTLYKHIVWSLYLIHFHHYPFCSCICTQGVSRCTNCSNSNILDVFWLVHPFSGTSQMNCCVQNCPGCSSK